VENPTRLFEKKLRQRFVEVLSLIAAIGLCIGYTYVDLDAEMKSVRQLTLIFSVTGFVSAFVASRYFARVAIGAILLTLSGLTVTLLPVYLDGGVQSPYVIWLVFAPLLGGFLIGPRLAYLTGGVGIIAVISKGLVLDSLLSGLAPSHSLPLLTLNLVLAILASTLVAKFTSTNMTRYRKGVNGSMEELSSKNFALEESDARFEDAMKLSQDAILIIDTNSDILVFNPAAEALYGVTADQVIGLPMPDVVIPPNLRSAHWTGFRNYLRTGEVNVIGKTLRVQSIHADGTEFTAELSVEEIQWGKGRQFIAYIRDLTENLRLEAEIEVQGKKIAHKARLEALGTLAGGVAHDFNNLLMVIRGYTEMLIERPDLGTDMRQQLGEIEHAGNRATEITQQLLAFSRLDSALSEHVDISEVVAKLVDLLARVLPDAINLKTKVEPSLWLVQSENAQLEQALMNLILNAVDAMPKGGTILLTADNVSLDEDQAENIEGLHAGDYGYIELADEGIGMDEETMEHIFEPFYTSKAIGEGTGLGLSTAYGIVQKSGGNISVTSQPGVGTTFKIYLPRSLVMEAPSSSPTDALSDRTGNHETILVVEDDASVRKLVVRSLLKAGYRIIEAKDGEHGYELAVENSKEIDLVLTDLNMPRLGGEMMIRRLQLTGHDFKVIYLSGQPAHEIAVEISDQSMVINKPFNLNRLAAAVEELLQRSS
jgi:two-component system, cell cycle sensor histidine kinase and response regulator CckA